MSRVCYLAGPIDQATDGAWKTVRTRLTHELRTLGFDVFRPDRAWDCANKSAGVQTVNDAVIRKCQLLAAVLPAGVPTLGTPVEVETAIRNRTPVLIVTDLESVQINAWAERGVVVCRPTEIGIGLLDVAAKVETGRRPLGDMVAQTASVLATLAAPKGLIFEPTDLSVVDSRNDLDLLPSRGYADDAGLDLYVAESTEIEPHSFVDVAAGVKVDIPKGYWILILGRSSTLRKRQLMVSPGVIDAGWTGPLFAGVWNLSDEVVKVEAGDRLAQAILLPAPVTAYRPEWGTVPAKERGEKGFGSTGA